METSKESVPTLSFQSLTDIKGNSRISTGSLAKAPDLQADRDFQLLCIGPEVPSKHAVALTARGPLNMSAHTHHSGLL